MCAFLLPASSSPIFNYYKSRLFFFFTFPPTSSRFRINLFSFFFSTRASPLFCILFANFFGRPKLLTLSRSNSPLALFFPYLSSIVSSISLSRSIVYSAHMYNLPPIELIYVTMDHSFSKQFVTYLASAKLRLTHKLMSIEGN